MVTVKKILGDDVAARVKPMWGLDEEGELRNVWRDTGVPNFWFMMGNLMWCRFHSKHLALRECLSTTVLCALFFILAAASACVRAPGPGPELVLDGELWAPGLSG